MATLVPVRARRPKPRLPRPDTEPLSAGTARLGRSRTGRWQIEFTERLADGKYRTRYLSTFTDDPGQAQDALERFKLGERATMGPDTAAPTPCLQPIFEAYLTDLGESSVRKRRVQEVALTWPRRLLGDTRPEDFNEKTMDQYVKRRRAERLIADGSLRRELGAVKAALRWAVRKQMLDKSALHLIKLPAGGAARNLWLDEATEARIHAAAVGVYTQPAGRYGESQRDTCLFLIMALNTAARREALLTLPWSRVDLARGMIDLRDPDLPVTRKKRVPVPISDRLRPVLEQAHHEACARGAGGVAEGRVFWRWSRKEGPYRMLQTFGRKHGVPWLTPHVCRHTWATLAARRGVTLYQIAGVLGDTLETVSHNYLHDEPDHLRSAINHHTKG